MHPIPKLWPTVQVFWAPVICTDRDIVANDTVITYFCFPMEDNSTLVVKFEPSSNLDF